MNLMKKILNAQILLFGMILILFASLTSCAVTNRFVAEENRILLTQDEAMRGTFNKGGQVVEYNYQLDGNTLKLNGRVYAHGNVNTLKVRVLFVDDKGYRLDEETVYYSGYRMYKTYGVPNIFQKVISLPQATDSFTFDLYVEYRTSRN